MKLKNGFLIFAAVLAGFALLFAGCGGGDDETKTYTVTFESNGGSEVAAQDIADGGLVTEPTAPTKTGFVFEGWFTEEGLENAWVFATDTVTGDMTLYAKWRAEAIIYTVTFNSNGGGDIPAQEITEGEKAEKPANPKKKGSLFDGWYSDELLTKAYDWTAPVSAPITLYAKWDNTAPDKIELDETYMSTDVYGKVHLAATVRDNDFYPDNDQDVTVMDFMIEHKETGYFEIEFYDQLETTMYVWVIDSGEDGFREPDWSTGIFIGYNHDNIISFDDPLLNVGAETNFIMLFKGSLDRDIMITGITFYAY